jgi:hypothetical protein
MTQQLTIIRCMFTSHNMRRTTTGQSARGGRPVELMSAACTATAANVTIVPQALDPATAVGQLHAGMHAWHVM